MSYTRSPASLFAVAVVSGFLLILLIGPAFLDQAAHEHSGATPVTAINCTVTCHQDTITERPVDCNYWHTREPQENLHCLWTARGIANVSFISDRGNYIMAPLTRAEYGEELVTNRFRYGSWDLEFLPDDSLLVTENPPLAGAPGTVVRYDDGERTVLKEIPVVGNEAVSGLMGLAVDPAFSRNSHIYLIYTHAYGGAEQETLGRVVRYTLDGGRLVNKTILLDDIPGGVYSSGSRLEFGPDGLLYITTGIRENRTAALDPHRLLGKVLRLDRDGTIPVGNPYGTPVYATGFKNPQGLAWHPGTGDLYLSMPGENRYDEINRVEPGRNYGYGRKRCDESSPFGRPHHPTMFDENLTPPVWCAKEWTLAPSGMTFVDDSDSPWDGNLFVASLRGKHLHRFILANGTVTHNEIFWYNKHMRGPGDRYFSRVRDVEYRDGALWVLMAAGSIVRFRPPG